MEEIDNGLQKKLNEIKTNVSKSQTDLEMTFTRSNGEISGRLTRLDEKVEKVQTWDFIELKIKEAIEGLQKELGD